MTFLSLSLQVAQASGVQDYNPVAYWSCDEASGVRYDSTANALNLTDNNTVTQGTGLLNGDCKFTASNSEYLSHTDDAKLEPGTAYTWTAWVKRSSDTDGMLFTKWNNANNGYWIFNQGGGAGKQLNFTEGDQTGHPSSGDYFSDNSWTFFAVTISGTTMKYYKNGTLTDTITLGTTPITDSTNLFEIGKAQFFNSNYFDGELDEIALFDTTLDATAISALYNSGTPMGYAGTSGSGTTTSTTTSTTISSDTSVAQALFYWLLVYFAVFFGLIYYFRI